MAMTQMDFMNAGSGGGSFEIIDVPSGSSELQLSEDCSIWISPNNGNNANKEFCFLQGYVQDNVWTEWFRNTGNCTAANFDTTTKKLSITMGSYYAPYKAFINKF